jgi:hypothetical protein
VNNVISTPHIRYLRPRDSIKLSPQSDLNLNPLSEGRIDSKNESGIRHPILDTALFDSQSIGLRFWVDSGKHSRRYGWGCISKSKETKRPAKR